MSVLDAVLRHTSSSCQTWRLCSATTILFMPNREYQIHGNSPQTSQEQRYAHMDTLIVHHGSCAPQPLHAQKSDSAPRQQCNDYPLQELLPSIEVVLREQRPLYVYMQDDLHCNNFLYVQHGGCIVSLFSNGRQVTTDFLQGGGIQKDVTRYFEIRTMIS